MVIFQFVIVNVYQRIDPGDLSISIEDIKWGLNGDLMGDNDQMGSWDLLR